MVTKPGLKQNAVFVVRSAVFHDLTRDFAYPR